MAANNLLNSRLNNNSLKTGRKKKEKSVPAKKTKKDSLLLDRLTSEYVADNSNEAKKIRDINKNNIPVNAIGVHSKTDKNAGMVKHVRRADDKNNAIKRHGKEVYASLPDERLKIIVSKDQGVLNDKENKGIMADINNLDGVLDAEHDKTEKRKIKITKINRYSGIIKKVSVLCVFVYLIFLIYGVIITDYEYDNNGNSVPIRMEYSDLKRLDNFRLLAVQFYKMQELYRYTLDLDYKLYVNSDEALALSAEYEGLLENVGKTATQIEAVSVSSSYKQVLEMITTWVKTDIAVYLQNMSAALSENSDEKASYAAEYREIMNNDYKIIESNLKAIGSKIKGYDIDELSEWNPEKYAKELTGE